MDDKRKYSFMYGEDKVNSGSKMVISGEFFDMQGQRYYKEYWPCIFKYIEDKKYYIEVDGKLCWSKNLQIRRLMVLNGKKIANPAKEDDIKAATIFLIIVMAISSIFKQNVLWWLLELLVYFDYVNKNKYT